MGSHAEDKMENEDAEDADFAAFEKLVGVLLARVRASRLPWPTAISALQACMAEVVVSVQCEHCRKQFLADYLEVSAPLLDAVRESIDGAERTPALRGGANASAATVVRPPDLHRYTSPCP